MQPISAKLAGRRALAILFFLPVLAVGVRAQAIDQSGVDRAHAFLVTRDVGKEVLNYVHMGADYHGHQYVKTLTVRDRPGHFALVYEFRWEDDGVSDIAFLCNASGRIYEVRVLYTNAVLNQPFLLADAAIQVLGNVLIQAYKDQLTAGQLRQVQKLVDDADAKGLLELSLMLDQAFSR